MKSIAYFPLGRSLACVVFALGVASTSVSAQTIFTASLTGAQEVPPNASTAVGTGTVVLNAAQTQITVDLSWSGLFAPASAAHIHGPAAPGVNAPVLFPLSGVSAATSGTIPEQTFAITSAQVADLFSGLLYMNIHDAEFPAGEIRGQLLEATVPESTSTAALLGISILGIFGVRRFGSLDWLRSPEQESLGSARQPSSWTSSGAKCWKISRRIPGPKCWNCSADALRP